MDDCSRDICSRRSAVVSLIPGDSSCFQLVASPLRVPLQLPLVLLRLPPLQLIGRHECNALGRMLLLLLPRTLFSALVGASLCHPLLLPALLTPSELAAPPALALALLALLVVLSLAPPSEVVLGAVLAPPSGLALRCCHRLRYPGGGVIHPRRYCC